MQETYSPEVRSAVLSTIQHPNYAKLAEFLMDGLTRDEIKEKVGFDDTQIDSMIAHIASVSAEVTPATVSEEAKVASPEVVSTDTATEVPVVPSTPAPTEENKDTIAHTQPSSEVGGQIGVGISNVASQPQSETTQPANTEELSA